MKFPVFSLNNREIGSRDEFARDYALHQRVCCEPDLLSCRRPHTVGRRVTAPACPSRGDPGRLGRRSLFEQLRNEATGIAGGKIESVEVYEVALHLAEAAV